MPQLIEHIDAIARKKQSDVCFLRFSDPAVHSEDIDGAPCCWNWNEANVRQAVIAWLQNNQISWRPCGDVADTNSMQSYAGQLYIDFAFDETDPDYQKTLGYLENADGSTRLPGVGFFVLKLEAAMKNAYHDEPGFWARWAEDF